MLVEPYSPDKTLKNFPNLYKDLERHFDLLYDQVPDSKWFDVQPRYHMGGGLKTATRDIFYYIDKLYDHAPQSVVDIGCGENMFADWFPNIVGVEPNPSEWSKTDFVDIFNSNFSQTHTNHYDCGMAINSLHFVDWYDVGHMIELAMNIVKDRFLFTLNFYWLENRPEADFLELAAQLRSRLETLPYDVVMFDHLIKDFARIKVQNHPRGIKSQDDFFFHHINGTVRFILQKR